MIYTMKKVRMTWVIAGPPPEKKSEKKVGFKVYSDTYKVYLESLSSKSTLVGLETFRFMTYIQNYVTFLTFLK